MKTTSTTATFTEREQKTNQLRKRIDQKTKCRQFSWDGPGSESDFESNSVF